MSGTGYDGSIRIDTSIDSGGFNTGISKLISGLKGLGAAVGIAFGVTAIVSFLKASAQAASDVQVMTNKFHAVFGSMSDDVEKDLGIIANATKASKDDLMGYAADIQTAFMGMQFPGQQAADLSVKVVKLSQDLATFNNMPTADVLNAIQSGMMGYTRELRQFGVVVDDNTIKAKAQAMGIWNGVGAMNAQIKAQAILQILTDDTTYAQGNATKSSTTWAGETRGLAAAWEEFKEAVGSAITVFAPIVGVIKQAVQWLTVLVTEFAQFISVMFGVNIDTSQTAANIADAAAAASDLTDNTAAAGKAAKGALASFDQINVLQQAASTATAPSAAGGSNTIAPYVPDTSGLDAIKAKVEVIKKSLLDFFAPLAGPFAALETAIGKIGGTIWDGLTWVWTNILQPFGKWLMQTVAPVFLLMLASILTVVGDVLAVVLPALESLWTNILQPLAVWTGGAFVTIMQLITIAFTALSTWISTHQDLFKTFVLIIAAIGLAFLLISSPILPAILAIAALIGIIKLLITYAPEIEAAFKAALEWIKTAFHDALEWIKTAFANTKTWIKTSIIDPVVNWFSGAFGENGTIATGIKIGLAAIVDTFTTIFGTGGTIQTALGTALQWINDTFTSTFTDVKTFVKTTINDIIGFINSMITAICGGINTVIKGLDSLGFTVPSWVPLIGGESWSFNVAQISAPQIPLLATGAVIPANSAFMAVLGDQKNGTNIEAPEALLRKIVSEEANSGPQTITINFASNLAALIRVMKPYIDKENTRVGNRLIKGNITT